MTWLYKWGAEDYFLHIRTVNKLVRVFLFIKGVRNQNFQDGGHLMMCSCRWLKVREAGLRARVTAPCVKYSPRYSLTHFLYIVLHCHQQVSFVPQQMFIWCRDFQLLTLSTSPFLLLFLLLIVALLLLLLLFFVLPIFLILLFAYHSPIKSAESRSLV